MASSKLLDWNVSVFIIGVKCISYLWGIMRLKWVKWVKLQKRVWTNSEWYPWSLFFSVTAHLNFLSAIPVPEVTLCPSSVCLRCNYSLGVSSVVIFPTYQRSFPRFLNWLSLPVRNTSDFLVMSPISVVFWYVSILCNFCTSSSRAPERALSLPYHSVHRMLFRDFTYFLCTWKIIFQKKFT